MTQPWAKEGAGSKIPSDKTIRTIPDWLDNRSKPRMNEPSPARMQRFGARQGTLRRLTSLTS